MSEVVIASYGVGNVASIQFALERLGARVRLTDEVDAIAEAERLILPGVGAAGYAIRQLQGRGLLEAVRAFPRPLLGVCLGQQLMFSGSDESPDTPLLGFLPGQVRALRPAPGLTIPHMGWSRLIVDVLDPLLEGVKEGAWAYFVHGYVCPASEATLALADYGQPIPAVVRTNLRWGCQFHPERSSRTGAQILANFMRLEA